MLHAIVREPLEPFRREVSHGGDGNGLPRFVEHEFRDFLRCGILAEGFYHTVLVDGCGQTPGKMPLGVAVVRPDGAPPGYGRALLRCLGGGLCLLTLGLGRLPVLDRTSWRERGRSRSGLNKRMRRYSASQTVSS